jgi:Tol biopolymer transport system component
MNARYLLQLFAFIIIAPVAGAQITSNQPAHLVSREESLGKLPVGVDVYSLTIDPTFKRLAYVVKRNGKELAVVDNVEGKEYDKVAEKNEMYFSPDGKRLAFVARHQNKKLVVVDGAEEKEYDEIHDLFNPVFSPDSTKLAYIASTFDPIKQRLGLWYIKDFVVVNGVEGQPYQMVEGILFSPDSKKLAYYADKTWNRGTCIVVNGVEGPQYSGISGAVFSPDSRRLAYAAFKWHPDRSLAVIDGKDGKEYEGSVEAVGNVIFSPDSKHTAYVVKGAGGNAIIRDGIPMKRFGAMQERCVPVFSPDSQHLAYVTHGSNWMIIRDDKIFDAQQVRQFTHDLVFSRDSQHLAYITRFDSPTNTGYDFLVVDGVVQKDSKNIFWTPVFSPNGERLVYLCRSGKKETLVYGDLKSGDYDRFITCDPDLSKKGAPGSMRVPFAIDKDGTIHAIAVRDGEIFRVEMKIVENHA